MSMIELQDKFAIELASSIDARWDSIQVHYENMVVNEHRHQIFTAFYLAGRAENEFTLSLECLDLLRDLNKQQPENQVEKWTWFEFVMDNTGMYKFDYKYGIPPHVATRIKYMN